MILYHGSNTEIETVNIERCKPYKDFGKGFYLTDIEEQAKKMAKRTALIYGGESVVNSFDFNIEQARKDTSLSVKIFDEADEEWALFVMANRSRTNKEYIHGYDIVVGPVADDTIATLFRNFDNGIIDLPMLVNGLKYKKVSSQYFFHTYKALLFLNKL